MARETFRLWLRAMNPLKLPRGMVEAQRSARAMVFGLAIALVVGLIPTWWMFTSGWFDTAMSAEYARMGLSSDQVAMQREFIELRRQANTEDKTAERSFLHVLDCCQAILLTLHWLSRQMHVCEAFNIAGELISIQKLLDQVSEVTGSEIKTVDAGYYSNAEFDQLGASTEKAHDILKWKAENSLKKALEDEWRFYQLTLRGQ